VPLDYEVLTNAGPTHVCDAAASALGDASRPALFCALRGVLGAIGIPVTSGGGVAQLIVPLMFAVIGVRLIARSWFLLVAPEMVATRAPSDDDGSPEPAEAKTVGEDGANAAQAEQSDEAAAKDGDEPGRDEKEDA
jgi:hypothetical protein